MPASPSRLDPAADPTEPAATVTTTVHTSWYDPDSSSWEPQPPALFEALRASPPRAPIAVGPGRSPDAVRPAARSRERRA